MFERLGALEEKYEELGRLLGDPKILEDHASWRKYAKAHAGLREVVGKYREYKAVLAETQDARAMLAEEPDAETKKFLDEELRRLAVKKEALEDQLKLLLLPKDPNDEKNVFVEIRAGAGGEEAALFAANLCRMYMRYAERRGWRVDMVDASHTDIGGLKEVVFVVEGEGAYSRLKYESGVHRVQRVPQTESGGRIHTSTATVAILPEADEVEVEIDPDDMRIDTFCASGPGGQSVNTTYSAVRVTHLPTGIVVSCQDEKSQHKNKEKAMRVLRARLLDMLEAQRQAEVAEARRMQVGTGDRSERIRTYNFPQSRVTDHRVGLTLHRLEEVLDGDLDLLVDALLAHDQAERLKQLG